MSTRTAVEAGLYLYGITDAEDGLDVALPGIEGGEVETIVADGVAAVVTPGLAPADPPPAGQPGGPSQALARVGPAPGRAPLRLRHGRRQRRAIAGSPPRQPRRTAAPIGHAPRQGGNEPRRLLEHVQHLRVRRLISTLPQGAASWPSRALRLTARTSRSCSSPAATMPKAQGDTVWRSANSCNRL